MYYVNHNVQTQQVQGVKENKSYNLASNNVNVSVTFLNKQGEAVELTYVDGPSGTKIGNAIENIAVPNNYKVVGYEYNGLKESLAQLENIQYVQGQENNIVVEIAEANVPTRIFYDIDNHMLPGTGNANITENGATILLNRGALRRFHVTSIQINGKTFNDFSIEGDVAKITGNIPAAVIADNTVVVNFARGSEVSQPKKTEASQGKKTVVSKPKKAETSQVKKAEISQPNKIVNQITTGWKVVNGQKYYYNSKGEKETGWKVIDGNRYYFNLETGVVEKGLQEIGGVQYYLNPTTGAQQIGVIRTKYGLEYFAGNGTNGEGLGSAIYYTGWLKSNGNRYYFGGNSKAETGVQTIDGLTFYFNPTTGVQETGVFKTRYGLEYFAGNPAEGEAYGQAIYYTGWLNLNGNRYYFGGNSKAETGVQTIDGLTFYFNPTTGVQETGVFKTRYGLEYFAGNPAEGEQYGQAIYYTGWLNLNGNKYYFQSSSKAATGTHIIDGKEYNFNNNGILIN